ncbi:hypothetical protein [Variovorax gossypii]
MDIRAQQVLRQQHVDGAPSPIQRCDRHIDARFASMAAARAISCAACSTVDDGLLLEQQKSHATRRSHGQIHWHANC